MEIIRSNPEITIPEIAKRTGLASRTIEQNIAELKKHGFLHRTGGRKEGFWVLTDEE